MARPYNIRPILVYLNMMVSAVFGMYHISEYTRDKIPKISGAAAFTIDNVMYAYGGEGRNGCTNRFSAFSFDATTGDLIHKALNEYGPHVSMADIAVMPDNASFTLFGGFYQDTLFDQAPMHAYHYTFENDTWSPLAVTLQPDDNTTIPRARQNFKAVMASDGLVYIFGGFPGPYDMRPRRDFWSVILRLVHLHNDPILVSPWIAIPPLLFRTDGRIVYLTGRYFVPPAYGFPTPHNMAVIYHTKDGSWENVTIDTTYSNGPIEPTTSATAVLGPEKRYLYLFGGDDFFTMINRTYYSNLYVLDTQTWTWYEPYIPGIAPKPRTYTSGTLITNEYLVFAFGYTAIDQTNDIDILKLASPDNNGNLDLSSGEWVTSLKARDIDDTIDPSGGLRDKIIAAIVVGVFILVTVLYCFRRQALTFIHFAIWNPRTGEPLWAELSRLLSKMLLLALFAALFVFFLLQVLQSPKATFTFTTKAPGDLIDIPDIRFCFEGYPVVLEPDTQEANRTYPLVACATDAGRSCADNIEPLNLSIHSPYFASNFGNLTCYLFRPGSMKLALEPTSFPNNGTQIRFAFYVSGNGEATGRTHVTIYPPKRDPNAYLYFGDTSQTLSDDEIQEWIKQDSNDFEPLTVIDLAPMVQSNVKYQLVSQESLRDVGWNYMGFSPVIDKTSSITVSERSQPLIPSNQTPNLDQVVMNLMYITSATAATIVEREQKVFSLLNAFGVLGGLFGLLLSFQSLIFGYRARSPFGLIHRWAFGCMRRSISDGLKDSFSVSTSTNAVPFVTPVHQRYSVASQNYGLTPYRHDKGMSDSCGSTNTGDSSNSQYCFKQQQSNAPRHSAPATDNENCRLINVEDRIQLMEHLIKSYYVDDEVFQTLNTALNRLENEQQPKSSLKSRLNFVQFIRRRFASDARISQEDKNTSIGRLINQNRDLSRLSTSSSVSTSDSPFQTTGTAQVVNAHEECKHGDPLDNKVD
ncbi:hypothetical protein RO3G_02372 [Lichtheimia corymbifera JMRC:FSU:9682]|uniref:Galactose oxidase n=1 Tax=Lichtheimia corymbifera JMRC:FSU:9682 TaxID=1263082 RepID=A0A068S006_9FUNG|nr:hypothetical protein RO3G_02372 [Lichtheimia corymbifera JMRC:FSU:9682]